MMKTPPRVQAVSLFLVAAALGGWLWRDAQAMPSLSKLDRVTLGRVEGLFSAQEVTGPLAVTSSYVERGAGETGPQILLGILTELEPLDAATAPSRRFRVSLAVEDRDGETHLRHEEVEVPQSAAAASWSYEAIVELPGEVRDIAVVVEELGQSLWGAAVAEESDSRMEVPISAVLSARPGVWSLLPSGDAPSDSTLADAAAEAGTAPEAPAAVVSSTPPSVSASRPRAPLPSDPVSEAADGDAGPGRVVRLLQPRGRLSGPTLIETLVSDFAIAKVEFQVDGKRVTVDEKEPFEARIELAGPGKPQRITAVALTADGQRLGEDVLEVNAVNRPFRVRFTQVAPTAEGGLDLAADVSLPGEAKLARVELFVNEERVAQLAAPPFKARVAKASSEGFVRVLAVLANGDQAEDVRLLGAQGLGEQIDVTLVQLYVVATDKEGRPVQDLEPAEFTVLRKGKPVRVDSARFAGDVPLRVGLVIDTSGSMQYLLEDTRRAAAQFLGQTLNREDSAFLVDFSNRPRLRHRATGKVFDLVASLRGLKADGATALFDAIVFSLVEFADGPGRRALVLLTDGEDYGSKFGATRAVRDARRLGVPVYVIALGGPRALSGGSRMEVEATASRTGGRLYFAEGGGDLDQAYGEINKELRSQYLLTFYVEGSLTTEDLGSFEVKLRRKGLETRVVTSASRLGE